MTAPILMIERLLGIFMTIVCNFNRLITPKIQTYELPRKCSFILLLCRHTLGG